MRHPSILPMEKFPRNRWNPLDITTFGMFVDVINPYGNKQGGKHASIFFCCFGMSYVTVALDSWYIAFFDLLPPQRSTHSRCVNAFLCQPARLLSYSRSCRTLIPFTYLLPRDAAKIIESGLWKRVMATSLIDLNWNIGQQPMTTSLIPCTISSVRSYTDDTLLWSGQSRLATSANPAMIPEKLGEVILH
ncbi:hypothetical protein VP01_5971g1 [Puccinia sorghi]|uniref:Uncharacterized protein n=1 Tax=Puccinia sorghi TaxID=27349 RepID=A0A0L6UJN5_9BASI|nr:hypothetical protein VP01_5971g1 [Puccinia sorghi]